MKRKTLPKEGKSQTAKAVNEKAEPKAAAEGLQYVKPPGILKEELDGGLSIRPFPEDLLREAEQEPNHRELAEYWNVIVKLREKGFSFREIADWLSERNVDADHNAVYRVYTKYMTRHEEMLETEIDRDEMEQASNGIGRE